MPITQMFNVAPIIREMSARGWVVADLARYCQPPASPSKVGDFLKKKTQTAPMALRIAKAFGYSDTTPFLPRPRAAVKVARRKS